MKELLPILLSASIAATGACKPTWRDSAPSPTPPKTVVCEAISPAAWWDVSTRAYTREEKVHIAEKLGVSATAVEQGKVGQARCDTALNSEQLQDRPEVQVNGGPPGYLARCVGFVGATELRVNDVIFAVCPGVEKPV